jgi:hypothetical protein
VEVEGDDDHAVDKTINRYARKGLSEPLARKQVRQEQRDYTLSQIDQVLDSLNDNTHQFTSGRPHRAVQSEFGLDGTDLLPNAAMAAGAAANAALTKDTMNAMRYFARPYHGIKSLMDMVDEVTDEFNR